MAVASSTLMLGQAIMGGIGAIAGGNAAKKQADFQASVANQQAEQEITAAAEAERDFRRNQDAQLAESRAAAGAGGIRLDAGSTLASFVDFKGEEELQAQRIRKGGEIKAQRLRQGAQLDQMAGSAAQLQGFTRAGSTLLTGFANYKDSTRKATASYAGS